MSFGFGKKDRDEWEGKGRGRGKRFRLGRRIASFETEPQNIRCICPECGRSVPHQQGMPYSVFGWYNEFLGVDTLICGGIDRFSARVLIFYRVRIYSWVTGMAEDALGSFLRGELESYTMVGSGGRSRGRWRFRGSN